MKNNLFYKVMFLAFVAFAAYGSNANEKEDTQIEHSYFWKVEKDGKTSYFLGPIHELVSIDELPCSREVQHRLENSDLVFVEIDHRSQRSREVIDIQNQWRLSEDGKAFWALGKKSQEFLRERGISEKLNLYGYTSVLNNLCNYGVDNIDGIRLDEKITNRAYSKGIPVQELDDFDEKIERVMEELENTVNTFNQLSSEEFWKDIRLIDQRIKQFYQQCPPQELVDKIEVYKLGLSVFYLLEAVKILSVLDRDRWFSELEKRNVRWLSRFEEAHKNYDRIFLSGGLAHFIDPVSLVGMLKEKGYTVELVTCEN